MSAPSRTLVLAVTLAAASCGGSSPPATTGRGGASGTGGGSAAGTGGASGSGGAAGTDGIPATPGCLAPFAAACPIAGACTWGGGGVVAGDDYRYCFASGTQLTRHLTAACGSDPPVASEMNTVTVRKPDGSICYSLEWTCACQFECEGMVIWKDPAGKVVATGTTSVAGKSITCTASGETASVPCASPSEPGCNAWPSSVLVYGYLNLPQSCDPGTCP
jgi:hypothetical protein